VSRFRRGPKRIPLSSLSSRDIDRMREFRDAELEFEENSGECEQRVQRQWLTPVSEPDVEGEKP
jgi:hypothetical protein